MSDLDHARTKHNVEALRNRLRGIARVWPWYLMDQDRGITSRVASIEFRRRDDDDRDIKGRLEIFLHGAQIGKKRAAALEQIMTSWANAEISSERAAEMLKEIFPPETDIGYRGEDGSWNWTVTE